MGRPGGGGGESGGGGKSGESVSFGVPLSSASDFLSRHSGNHHRDQKTAALSGGNGNGGRRALKTRKSVKLSTMPAPRHARASAAGGAMVGLSEVAEARREGAQAASSRNMLIGQQSKVAKWQRGRAVKGSTPGL